MMSELAMQGQTSVVAQPRKGTNSAVTKKKKASMTGG